MPNHTSHSLDAASPIRLLRREDLPGAMRLKECAGWNQTTQDWERLLELEPNGCFGLDQDGRLAASTTVLTYGKDLAWIGMVLTLPEFRGHGFASMLMQHAIDYSEQCGIARLGLDATSMGIGVYRRLGFEPVGILKRWARPDSADQIATVALDAWQPDRELDRRAFGADRSALLRRLARLESAFIPRLGFAMGRPGHSAAYFGPCVTDSSTAATTFLHWFLAKHPAEQVYWDILADNREAEALAREHGFAPVRELTRMVRVLRHDAQVAAPDARLVYATAGLECG